MTFLGYKNAIIHFVFVEKSITVPVCGDSMFPAIKNRQYLQLVRLGPTLIPGCCYLFENNSSFIVHRLVGFYKKKCVFMGDNSTSVQVIGSDKVIARALSGQLVILGVIIALINCLFLVAIFCHVNKIEASKIRNAILSLLIRKE